MPAVNNITTAICSGGTFTATPANGTNGIVPAGTTYTWGVPAVTGGITGGVAGGGANISGTLTNPGSTAATVTYTVTPVSGSCTGSAFTVTVTVNPMPAVNDITSSICSGSSFTEIPVDVTDGVVPAGTTYTWSAPSVTGGITGGSAGTNAANISGTLTNPTSSVQTATYTVTPKSGSCTGATFTVTVTVNPKPAVNNMTATICSNAGFSVTPLDGVNGLVPGGTDYTWLAPAVSGGITGGAAGNGATINGTLSNPTNTAQTAIYTVTPNAGSCTGATFTVTITVNPEPSVTDITSTVCSGVLFTVTPVNFTNGIVPLGTTYSWLAPTVSGGLTGGAAGSGGSISGTLVNPSSSAATATYTVTPVSGTCTGSTFTVTVTVNPMPSVNNITATICSGGSFTSTPADGTDGVVPSGTTYSWAAPAITGGIIGGAAGSGAADISGTLINPSSSVQTATYTVTPASGSCTGATFTVTVTVNPKPSVSAMTATICSGNTFTATPVDVTNGVVPAGTSYTWTAPSVTGGITGGAGGTGAGISGTLTNPTNTSQIAIYTVTPASGTCTGANFTVTVTVNPMPSVSDMTSTICSGATFISAPANGINGVVPVGTPYTWGAPVVTASITGKLPAVVQTSAEHLLIREAQLEQLLIRLFLYQEAVPINIYNNSNC